MNAREERGLVIAALCKLNHNDQGWFVPSQSGDKVYKVDPTSQTCTCPDHQEAGHKCKHIFAVEMTMKRECRPDGTIIDTQTVTFTKKTTYKQNWPAYNKAQLTEKHRLQVLLHDLCRGIPEPEYPASKRGPAKTPLADQVFAITYKVYSTVSGRRFNCDLQDAIDKGHMSKPMAANKICVFLESKELTPILHSLIVESSLPLRSVEKVFAPDSTGFSTSRFVRWYDEKYGMTRSGKEWVKAHVMTGVKTNIVTAVIIEDKHLADCPQFKPLVEETAKNFKVDEVTADKAYLSRENLELLQKMGGTAFIPFKSNSVPGEYGSVWEKMYGYYHFRRDEFMKHYHQRSNAESTFSMVKAKFRDHVRSKTDVAMKNEVLCKLLCHNLCVLIQSQCELGIEPVFWQDEATDAGPAVLQMTRVN